MDQFLDLGFSSEDMSICACNIKVFFFYNTIFSVFSVIHGL